MRLGDTPHVWPTPNVIACGAAPQGDTTAAVVSVRACVRWGTRDHPLIWLPYHPCAIVQCIHAQQQGGSADPGLWQSSGQHHACTPRYPGETAGHCAVPPTHNVSHLSRQQVAVAHDGALPNHSTGSARRVFSASRNAFQGAAQKAAAQTSTECHRHRLVPSHPPLQTGSHRPATKQRRATLARRQA